MHSGYKKGLGLLAIAGGLMIGAVVVDMAWSAFPSWARLLCAILAVVVFAGAVLSVNVAWEAGRAERAQYLLVEQRLARAGHAIWFAGSTLGIIGLMSAWLAGESRISAILAVFGIIAMSISGVLGGWPSAKKGLSPLLLSKRIMNWQLAVSVAVVVPLLGKSVGTDEDLMEAVGTNWGYPALVALIWILAAGVGTMLYEPLKYRLEEQASNSQRRRSASRRPFARVRKFRPATPEGD